MCSYLKNLETKWLKKVFTYLRYSKQDRTSGALKKEVVLHFTLAPHQSKYSANYSLFKGRYMDTGVPKFD